MFNSVVMMVIFNMSQRLVPFFIWSKMLKTTVWNFSYDWMADFSTPKIFDNEEFDCRTPQDWLSLGTDTGSTERKPVPAKALLPKYDKIPTGKFAFKTWNHEACIGSISQGYFACLVIV